MEENFKKVMMKKMKKIRIYWVSLIKIISNGDNLKVNSNNIEEKENNIKGGEDIIRDFRIIVIKIQISLLILSLIRIFNSGINGDSKSLSG